MERRIHMTKWTVIKALLTIGTIGFCFSVWPGYGIHACQTETRYTYDVSQTQWLSGGDIVYQSFSPVHCWLSKIMLAVAFDESVPTDDYLVFSLWDAAGEKILEKDVGFAQIENTKYFGIPIHKKLKVGEEYAWSLSLPETADMQYAILDTGDIAGNARENISLAINGEGSQRNALSQFEYYAHFDKVETFGSFWCGAIIVWFALLELTDRAEQRWERRRSEREEKVSE